MNQIFMLIIANLYQLSISAFFNYFQALGTLFIPPKICPGLTIFNSISSVILLIKLNIWDVRGSVVWILPRSTGVARYWLVRLRLRSTGAACHWLAPLRLRLSSCHRRARDRLRNALMPSSGGRRGKRRDAITTVAFLWCARCLRAFRFRVPGTGIILSPYFRLLSFVTCDQSRAILLSREFHADSFIRWYAVVNSSTQVRTFASTKDRDDLFVVAIPTTSFYKKQRSRE